MYSEIVMDHFKNPRNVGEIEDADGVGEVGNPVCGDMMSVYIKVKDDRIDDIKFKTFGCGAAIAVSSMVTEMARGNTLDEVMKITNKDVAAGLGGLPKNKLHCSNLGADALHQAVTDYLDRKSGKPPKPVARQTEHEHTHGDKCYCPYCDAELDEPAPYCTSCGREVETEHH
ncbi:MAG: Fe-S cluster assembly scaffold protein NifU [Proteobacteria bacterium]|nr:Fe-S cluster assembly scaffold protein NifU [Pseudomonadota bacterium]